MTVTFIIWITYLSLTSTKASPTPLTINGHLVTVEALNPAEHQIIFKRIGEYATNVEYHHIHIPVNLMEQVAVADKAKHMISHYAETIYQETLMHYHQDNQYPDEQKAKAYANLLKDQNTFVANTSGEILDRIKVNLISTTTALPHLANKQSKRQIGLLFGLLGTSFATANAIHIAQMEKNAAGQRQQILKLTHIAEIEQNHLQHLDLQVITNEKQTLEALRYNPAMLASAANLLIFQTKLVEEKIQSTIQEAQNNRLSTQLLEGHTINKMFNFLTEKAKQSSMNLMISRPSDIFQMDTTYFYKQKEMTLNLFVHIPMIQPANLLQFFQLVPFPISTTIKANASMMPEVKQDMLAVGAEHQFQIVSQSDLNACSKLGTSYLCQGRHTTRTDLEDTCLGAYYLERWDVIHKLCRFNFEKAKEHVFKIAANQWVVSTPKPFSTTVKCNSQFSSVNLKSLSIVTVPEGCTMHLKTHIIHPGSYTQDTDVEIKHFQWMWNPHQMFPHYNTKAFNATMNSLKETGSISIDYINHEVKLKKDSQEESNDSTKDLIQELKDSETGLVHPNISFIVLMTIILLGSVSAIYYVFIHRHNIRTHWNQNTRSRRVTYTSPIGSLEPRSPNYRDHQEYNPPLEMQSSSTRNSCLKSAYPSLPNETSVVA